MRIPEGYFYSKDHEWLKVEGDMVRIGITDYAQDSLGDVVYVELPDSDTEFQTGDVFGVVESVKAASDLYIPISGKIVDVNVELSDNPEIINEDPYGGRMIVIEMSDSEQLNDLLSPEEYEKFCSEEG